MAGIQTLREKINLVIYKYKDRALRILRLARLATVVLALGTLVYYFGFPHTQYSQETVFRVIRGVFGFLIFSYIFRFFFDFEPVKFLRNHKYEGILLGVLVLDFIGKLITGSSFSRHFFEVLGFEGLSSVFVAFSCLVMFIFTSIEVVRGSRYISDIKLSPSTLFIGSFILLILAGTGLLMLPEATTTDGPMPFLDALFTSTSASCVTGLIVVDTATYFTLKGKIILMILMQLGGLNIISFTSFFSLFSQKGPGLRQQAIIMNFMSFESLSGTKKLLKDILLMAAGIELIGSILIYFLWHPDVYFATEFDRIFSSLFHSVSAFNNAGFSLYTNNMYEAGGVRKSYMVHIVIMLLIIFGGLGFHVIKEVFGAQNMRERLRRPWKTYTAGTKIVLYTTAVLIVFGTVFFYIAEINNPAMYRNAGDFGNQSFVPRVITAAFQSVATRTAGFNSVDMSVLTTPVILIFIFLMFVGASPASTGGGIKTTTFAVIFLSAISTITNRHNVMVFKRTIPKETIGKAYTVVLFSVSIIFISILAMAFADPEIPLEKLSFEVVSAYCTVGLSTGITAGLSMESKVILVLCMFIGRVGILTLAISLSRKIRSNNYSYPSTFIMVG